MLRDPVPLLPEESCIRTLWHVAVISLTEQILDDGNIAIASPVTGSDIQRSFHRIWVSRLYLRPINPVIYLVGSKGGGAITWNSFGIEFSSATNTLSFRLARRFLNPG